MFKGAVGGFGKSKKFWGQFNFYFIKCKFAKMAITCGLFSASRSDRPHRQLMVPPLRIASTVFKGFCYCFCISFCQRGSKLPLAYHRAGYKDNVSKSGTSMISSRVCSFLLRYMWKPPATEYGSIYSFVQAMQLTTWGWCIVLV